MHLNPGQRRQPKQLRSRMMVETIVEAAEQIFTETGYEQATTNQIAERAGISIGSLYQYFPNKDSLIFEVQKAHHDEQVRVVKSCIAGSRHLSFRDAIKVVVLTSIENHSKSPKLHAAFEEWIPAGTKLIDRTRFEENMVSLLTEFLRERTSVTDSARLQPAIFVIMNMCRSVVHAFLHAGQTRFGRDDIVTHLTDSILGCLKSFEDQGLETNPNCGGSC
ncbi:TetR/AcrR family transcriptional regulator [uncultured Roseibium sp.]|uniref:TetR/AcrR family transcriptional regulator n=1 Tax=uncultured Roseibium sp. TaxID=1936171 RepID=UPI0026255C85|nr:TetR/AcrR family transcriptional regulator [uncultured Roseibium sp.]